MDSAAQTFQESVISVMDDGFGYKAIKGKHGSSEVTSLIAYRIYGGPAQGVIWNVGTKDWTFSPESAARFLFDDRFYDMSFHVGRSEAVTIARETLGAELPSEDALRRMCADGAAGRTAESLSDGPVADHDEAAG